MKKENEVFCTDCIHCQKVGEWSEWTCKAIQKANPVNKELTYALCKVENMFGNCSSFVSTAEQELKNQEPLNYEPAPEDIPEATSCIFN